MILKKIISTALSVLLFIFTFEGAFSVLAAEAQVPSISVKSNTGNNVVLAKDKESQEENAYIGHINLYVTSSNLTNDELKTLSWSTSDSVNSSVDEGRVTITSEGTFTITASVTPSGSTPISSTFIIKARMPLSYYLPYLTMNLNDIASDVDKTPRVYTEEALEYLRYALDLIVTGMGKTNDFQSISTTADWIKANLSTIEDTEENCTKVKAWTKELRDANSAVDNSVLATENDTEFWAKWNEAYELFTSLREKNYYTQATWDEVSSIITQVSDTEWVNNKDDKSKLDTLADNLVTAIGGLKVRTTFVQFKEEQITKNAGDGAFFLDYTKDGDDEIAFSSSDTNVAAVDENGKVTIKKACPNAEKPYITVTASSKSNSGIKDTIRIVINNPVSEIKINADVLKLYIGSTVDVPYEIIGVDKTSPVTDLQVSLYSSNPESALVADNQIKALKSGEGTITVACGNKSNSVAFQVLDSIKVNIIREYSITTSMTVGEKTTLRMLILPKEATNKTIKWSSSDKSVATITSLGTDNNSLANAEVTALKEGKTVISYTTTDGSTNSGSFTLFVKPLVNSLTLDKTAVAAYFNDENNSVIITPTILPSNAGNQVLTWVSSDDSIVTVSDDLQANAKLTFHRTGKATVYAYTNDGSDISASCEVYVLGSCKSLSMSKETASMKVGGGKLHLACTGTFSTLSGYLSSEDYPDMVQWSTSNENLAVVAQDGTVTALLPGKVTVYAAFPDGHKAQCVVTITAPLKGIALPENMTLYDGKSKQAPVTYTPEYASNKNVTYTVSDKSVIKISSDGVVTAVGVGTAIITATSEEKNSSGNPYVSVCKVTVLQPVKSISLNASTKTLYMDKTKTFTLKATISPSNASDKTVDWSTSNKSVATVSKDGLVTAKGPGKCKITASSRDGSYKVSCSVTVIQPLKGISFTSSKKSYYVGQQGNLGLTFNPTNASNQKVTYSSSDKSVATVSSSGLLTAKDTGTCVITAKSNDGGYTAKCTVTVNPKIDVKSIKLSTSSSEVYKDGQTTIKVSFSPSNASNKEVKWSSSNEKVATVSLKGVVTGIKGGKATITCKSKDTGAKATITVSVYEFPEQIKLSSSSVTIVKGKQKTITATVLPSSATDKSLKWYTSNTKIATVKNGTITAVKAGTCYLYAKSKADSSVKTRCKITVLQPPTKVTVPDKEISIYQGNGVVITPKVTPSNAYDKSVTWKSSKPQIAYVSKEGKITARSVGTAVITCTCVGNEKATASIEVTVMQKVTGVELSSKTITLITGRTKTITATVLPKKATNRKVSFKTNNRDVATVTSKGVIEAVGPGTATITVITDEGLFYDKCTVTVIEQVTSVKLSRSKTLYLGVGDYYTVGAIVSPTNATNKNVVWKSSNSTVARVSQSGKITALRPSDKPVYISATTQDGGYTAKLKVYCIIKSEGVKLNKTAIGMFKGDTFKLKATVLPADATYNTVTWQTSDTKVAIVDYNGNVTAVGKGVCTVTCTTKEGGFKATCTVKVSK